MPIMTLYSISEIAADLGLNKSTVSRHAAKLGVGSRVGNAIVLTAAEAERLKKAAAGAKVGNPNFVAGNHFGKPPKKSRKSS